MPFDSGCGRSYMRYREKIKIDKDDVLLFLLYFPYRQCIIYL